MEIRIYYEDTDCGEVVYYANYLRYFERARTEYLRERGVEVAQLAQRGYLFMVSHVDISYRHPARYNDLIKIHTEIEKVKQASFSLSHEVKLAGIDRIVVTAKVQMACVGQNGKPTKLPLDVLKVLQ